MTTPNQTPEDRESLPVGDSNCETATDSVVNSTANTGHRTAWVTWAALSAGVIGVFLYGIYVPASQIQSAMLPGETTHGHHQIELACNVCHSPKADPSDHDAANVMQNACIECHGQQLQDANDTHPAKKFNDPVNAEKLLVLNAQDCLTCHREHVPEQTQPMGLTMPSDYCWHCHQDVAQSRPSHQAMAFDSCATAGCHNYHDNRALYEKFLDDHHGEPDLIDQGRVPRRDIITPWQQNHPERHALDQNASDAPDTVSATNAILNDWADTAHASAGVNCTDCHQIDSLWSDSVSMQQCETCHQRQVETFQTGKHGMRLAAGLSPMKPELARLPMHSGAAHRELNCSACHSGHRFDTQFAAVQACLSCHADSHSLAYQGSAHAELWSAETMGEAAAGSGVSCATCHLPRLNDGDSVWVNHDQNAGLRPSETMARQVCLHCHSLEYSLSALSDPHLLRNCFSSPVIVRTKSVEMAHQWFESKKRSRTRRSPTP
ncbi:cytochrome c3 family protein [Stieleria varia]|uniref:nitrite reductase (cytochrome; ammonia-forming) n=1 Tax=Stieleria varia TaxID=2528005 RepID=A0A5C6AU69_9BACT|nr:cytochrome c3 family protein [Stieleria varia]TWU02981.1 Class III cytochrome C family protein [Stieleria varia]